MYSFLRKIRYIPFKHFVEGMKIRLNLCELFLHWAINDDDKKFRLPKPGILPSVTFIYLGNVSNNFRNQSETRKVRLLT